jgi:hypothetical protein
LVRFFLNLYLVSKKLYNFDIFKTTEKLKKFEPEKSYHSVDLNELILKMYTVLRFEIVFHKIIEEI